MTNSTNKPNVLFWVIGIIALIWNAMGVMAYLGEVYRTEDLKLNMSEAELAYLEAEPAWYTAVFAIAVFAGVLGCILLLLRKKLAYTLFVISLLAVIAQQVYHFVLSDALEIMGTFDITMSIMVVIISIFLVWYSKDQIKKEVLS